MAEAADARVNPKLEIAHVLTMDIVEYSKLLITEQSKIMAQLTRLVRETARFRRAEVAGKLLRLPTGDGIVLVFFDDPEAPVECASEISAAIKNHPDIPLRMGIHSGPVNQVIDVNDRFNIAGAGIDIAQRVMDCGDAGHILLSKRVADDLVPLPQWNPCLHELGECEVKHGRKVSLVNFYTNEIGNPNLPRNVRRRKRRSL
jgi:Adenylate cyclase, family 3 (some proteins contain HAMP domain)